ncbi:MAG: CoA pyrophosphatase [Acidobacteria bacterium]|nr:CoA pyrophosphatase [Acidobacteriota bacterium]
MSEAVDALTRFLRARLTSPLPGPQAQRRFAPQPLHDGWSPDAAPATARRAAAVILIYPGASGPTIPLTERQHDLPHHPGQISLPGGAIDPGESPETAALRELDEEIGVSADVVEIIGALSPLYVLPSHFVVQPFVAVARAAPRFQPHPKEVAALIDAPLADLRDPANISWATRDRRGLAIDFPYFDVRGSRVWGATAMVLGEFVCLWDAGHAPPDRRARHGG